jgi:glutathione S-transferase
MGIKLALVTESNLVTKLPHEGVHDMLKLYYASGACSISPHIALREAGLPFSLERVDFKAGKKLENGDDFTTTVNPKGYVPALGLPDGKVLTEGVAIVQYIADQKPESGLAPPAGTWARVELTEWLNFISTELHKGLSPVFSAQASDEYKQAAKDKVASRLKFIAHHLTDKQYLLGDRFSVADGYLFYVLRSWQRFLKQELPDGLSGYYARLAERPSVKESLDAEGIAA